MKTKSNINTISNESYRFYLIGNGSLANSLAAHFQQKGISFLWFKSTDHKRYFSKSDEVDEPTIYFLAVNESNLRDILKEFKRKNKKSLYCHFSASEGLEIFPDMLINNAFILHPMQSFPSKDQIIQLEDCYFTFQGKIGLYDLIEKKLDELDLNSIFLDVSERNAYHLIGVFVSNFLISLLSICERLGNENKLSKDDVMKLVSPIVKQTLQNANNKDLKNALSGPFKRNELDVIKRHQQYLSTFDKDVLQLYDLLNIELRKLLDQDSKNG